MDIEKNKWMHETFLYPMVRVFAQKSAGSGTIIYSQPDPKHEGDYISFVLTNHHVIADLISHKNEWDSMVGKKIEKEIREKAKIETFSYIYDSTVDSSNRYEADIIAHDVNHDLAILKISSPRQFKHTANLISKKSIKKLRLFMDVVVSGCSMAHEPFCNFGQLTFLQEIIDQKKYFMVNASSVFGNSGGGLFLRETGELIGVPSRITVLQLGFGQDVLTWMGFAAHSERLYEFVEEQELKFLIDSGDDYYKAMDRRKKRKNEALLALKAEVAQAATVQINKTK